MSLVDSLAEQIKTAPTSGARKKVLWRAYWLEREGKLNHNDYLYLAHLNHETNEET